MKLLRMKYPALLLTVAYLLFGAGALAADSCVEPTTVLADERVLAAACCGQSADSAPANAHPCGACFDHCDQRSHATHVASSPFVKRFGKTLSARLPSLLSSPIVATRHSPSRTDRQRLLPNPVLASLRTVVLLI